MDLMSLDGQSVFHIVDKETLFSAACFLSNGETAKDVWDAYIVYCVNPYSDYWNEIHEDQGPQFQSSEWKNLLHAAGIKPTDSGVESHNALGARETYHEYLCQIFGKVTAELRQQPIEQDLSIAVHAVNSTAGTIGLAPMLLVFGLVPRTPVKPRDLPEQRERMLTLPHAIYEMVEHIAKSRLSSARRMNVTDAVGNCISVDMEVLLYREKPVNT